MGAHRQQSRMSRLAHSSSVDPDDGYMDDPGELLEGPAAPLAPRARWYAITLLSVALGFALGAVVVVVLYVATVLHPAQSDTDMTGQYCQHDKSDPTLVYCSKTPIEVIREG